MPTLGSLVIEMRADLARLQTDMNKGVGIVERGAASMRAAAGIAKSALGGLAAGLVGGLSVGALASVVKNVADYGDHLNDLSKSTGASVEQLSFLNFAAKQSGSSIDGLSSAIAKMQKNLAEVAKGAAGPAAKALATLKINAADLVKTDLVTQIGTIGDALNKIRNPAERAALGIAVVGKGFRDAAPLFAEGSNGVNSLIDDFIKLGGVVTKEQAERFDALNDAVGRFELAALGAGVALTDHLAGPLTNLINQAANGPGKIASFFEGIGASLRNLGTTALNTVPQFNLAMSAYRAITGDPRKPKLLTEPFGPPRPTAQQRADSIRRSLLAGAPSGDVTDGLTDAQEKAAARLKQSQADYLNGLRTQIILQGNSTELAKVQAAIAADTTGKFDKQTRDTAIALATQLDLLIEAQKIREESAEVEKVLADYVRQRNELEGKASDAQISRAQSITESLRTPLEAYIDTVKELTDLAKVNAITPETLQRGIKSANTEMVDAQNKASGLRDMAKDLGLTFTSAFEDAVIGANKFSDVLKGLADDITRLLIRKSVTEPLINSIGGFLGSAFGGAASGGGGFTNFGALFGNDRGGLYKVGGGGGEHPVAFTAKAGEYVAVGTGMSNGGQAPTVIIYDATPGTTARPTANGRDVEVFVGGAMTRNAAVGRSGLRPPLATR